MHLMYMIQMMDMYRICIVGNECNECENMINLINLYDFDCNHIKIHTIPTNKSRYKVKFKRSQCHK